MTDLVLFDKSIKFLKKIGIETKETSLQPDSCFLPGFLIDSGTILFDRSAIKYPGDLLHEAAHIAVVPAAERSALNGHNIGLRKDANAEEMMSIAWSFAACQHLEIDPNFVFHEEGYKGGGALIVENFKEGNYFGVPVLEWLNMTTTKKGSDHAPYPHMIKWLRD